MSSDDNLYGVPFTTKGKFLSKYTTSAANKPIATVNKSTLTGMSTTMCVSNSVKLYYVLEEMLSYFPFTNVDVVSLTH